MHHGDVLTLGGVQANADAGVGNHDLGQTLFAQTQLGGADQGIGVGHVNAVNLIARSVQLKPLGPGFHLLCAAGQQGQTVAGAGITFGQGLANAAGGAGDENQGSVVRHRASIREAASSLAPQNKTPGRMTPTERLNGCETIRRR